MVVSTFSAPGIDHANYTHISAIKSLFFQVAKSQLEQATVQLKLVQQEKVATRQVTFTRGLGASCEAI